MLVMNQRLVFPNNPIFFLQFIFLPFLIGYICHKAGITVDSIVQTLGPIRIAIIIAAYFLFVIGIIKSSILIISDDFISGPGTEINLFSVKLPLINSECAFESRSTGRFRCECLIIKNKYKKGEICLPNVYFTYDLFNEIMNLIKIVNEQRQN